MHAFNREHPLSGGFLAFPHCHGRSGLSESKGFAGFVDPIGTLIDNCPICRLFVQVESIPLKITEHRGVYVYLCRLFLQTKQAKIGYPPRPTRLNEEDLRGGF